MPWGLLINRARLLSVTKTKLRDALCSDTHRQSTPSPAPIPVSKVPTSARNDPSEMMALGRVPLGIPNHRLEARSLPGA